MKKEKHTSENISPGTGLRFRGVGAASSTGYHVGNKELQSKYDEMHSKGPTSWFSDGREERETILKMGEPWEGVVFEIGCGEGDLGAMIRDKGATYWGIDYSEEAIRKAKEKYPYCHYLKLDYKKAVMLPRYLVMQGVLEHLDDPFCELQWMIENFKPKTVITSSPCFLNPRGIVWMTLDMLGAVMSKTDLHFLDPRAFHGFCIAHNYQLDTKYCDFSWGNGDQMVEDLKHRIPLALKDGNLPIPTIEKFHEFLHFLDGPYWQDYGATAVYRIDID